jgi:hypothetical protein
VDYSKMFIAILASIRGRDMGAQTEIAHGGGRKASGQRPWLGISKSDPINLTRRNSVSRLDLCVQGSVADDWSQRPVLPWIKYLLFSPCKLEVHSSRQCSPRVRGLTLACIVIQRGSLFEWMQSGRFL